MWHCHIVRWGPVQYANADGTHVAFMEVTAPAAGDLEIVMLSGAFWPMESFADDPIASRLVEGLATLGRVVLFDRRGVGLSDPVIDRTTSILEQWADDVAAVVEAAGYARPIVFSWHNAPIGPTFAIRYPELLSRLVLFNPSAPVNDDDSGWIEEFFESQERLMAGEELDERYQAFPHRRKDPAFVAWNEAAGRAGASPSQARRLQKLTVLAPFPDLSRIRTPTLVVTRTPAGFLHSGRVHSSCGIADSRCRPRRAPARRRRSGRARCRRPAGGDLPLPHWRSAAPCAGAADRCHHVHGSGGFDTPSRCRGRRRMEAPARPPRRRQPAGGQPSAVR